MIVDKSKLSPMMKRYMEVKAQYSDCLLFFRLGDFYEMFFDDAELASRELDLTLTGRDCGLEERAPMCGVPYHAVDNYIRKLIDKGYRVAICEQLNDPSTAEGMLDRDVVRVVSGGTVMEDDILDANKSNYLCSVYYLTNGFGVAWSDISTGEFYAYQFAGEGADDRLSDLLSSIKPKETVCNNAFLSAYQQLQFFKSTEQRARCYHDFAYGLSAATKKIFDSFGVPSLKVFELDDLPYATAAAGGLLEYLAQTQKRTLKQLTKIEVLRDKSFMMLDAATRRNLELTARAIDGKKQGSLLGVLDRTHTAMGARTLRKFIEQPLQDPDKINRRLDAVEELVQNKMLRDALCEQLKNVHDLERLCGRLAYGSASPKDLLSIFDTLETLPYIKTSFDGVKSTLLKSINSSIKPEANLCTLLQSALDRQFAVNFKGGSFIKDGYDKQLDSFRNMRQNSEQWLRNLEANERENTGIRTLKVGYNRVIGYYFEVSKGFIDKVPYRFHRKQTLTTGERFITEELKDLEEKILSADSNAQALEEKLFFELRQKCFDRIVALKSTAQALSVLDALLSFASASAEKKYVKPNIGKKVNCIRISDGRHPVVESLLAKGAYVPNDTLLDDDENRTMIITGPNMAGKSTYMRQVALIVLMAHIGCFVPAKSADIALTDRIFTRIGASDDLSGGQSTFMVEMIEVATILNHATASSLLVLDEIGRGTSTFDGLSIAWAVLEHITDKIRAKTLFATHFHELTELEELNGVKNYRVLISEQNGNVVFLHKIAPGGASRSFGIEVASLAGVSASVVERAKSIMKSLEADSKNRDTNEMLLASSKNNVTSQVSLFDIGKSKIDKQIAAINVDNITPLQALTILCDLKKQLEDG